MAEKPPFELKAGDIDWLESYLLGPLAEAGALILRDAIVEQMGAAAPRTGREYYIPGTTTGAKYTASAPGEPPAERTGEYLSGWVWEKAVVTKDAVVAFVSNDVVTEDGTPLGLILEEGTSDILRYQVRMEPRPHIRPAIAIAEKQFQALLDRAERGR